MSLWIGMLNSKDQQIIWFLTVMALIGAFYALKAIQKMPESNNEISFHKNCIFPFVDSSAFKLPYIPQVWQIGNHHTISTENDYKVVNDIDIHYDKIDDDFADDV